MANDSLDIRKLQESIFVKKDEGTEVNYFLYPEFEIHKNVLTVGVIQEWHTHTVVEEVIVCTNGVFHVETIENHSMSSVCVKPGDVVRVKNSVHRLVNSGEADAEFLVFRFVPDGTNKQEIIKQDKCVYTENQIQDLLKKREE
ncbi:cupin domain-containing protein [Candidatus Enterococcus clewellii]|uniref:Uncharacterized protein n=1 Tax=Candidatus Enterococcus clewellii TaxID=1834193 RepID=A0A242KC85_9ENTE|nr:cupin domain-containing protein [Enterococcus sp. 9E7_DIV0242]OTP18576.1 hypothetical protein A5888_000390 [Enterococcus sp. 9E7_DIV0242]